jgi:hypothetical protein
LATTGIIIAITAIVGPMIAASASVVDQTSQRRPPRRILTPGAGFEGEGRRDKPATLSHCLRALPTPPKMCGVSPILT